MRHSALRLLLAALLLSPASAEDRPRFSTGLIESGEVKFELDIAGATKLTIGVTGKPSPLDRSEIRFIDADGKSSTAEDVRTSDASAKSRWSYDLREREFVKLTFEARVVPVDQQKKIHVLVDHDAPRAKPKPSTESIVTLQGNAARGRNVFFGRGTCASCHAFEGRGASVGPDLTQLGKRSKREQIIESITAPDAALAAGFETDIVETKDGTPHLGFVVADSKELITLKDSAGQLHKIDKKDVAVRKPQSFSLMPPFGELLTPQQIADLAAFLSAKRG